MIDPSDVIKFDRTDAELQEWWLFSVLVAGKTAITQARLLDAFLIDNGWVPGQQPFDVIRRMVANGTLEFRMREARLGQYTRLVRTFSDSLMLDLATCSLEQLEAVHGVGPKTARMFLMHSRPGQRVAALDTHILKHLGEHGHAVPKATPTGVKYRELELAFLALADAAGQTPADYDLAVWKSYAHNEGSPA